MDDKTKAEQEAATAAAKKAEEDAAKAAQPSQDAIKDELDKVQKKGEGRTKLEKAIFSKRKIEEEIERLAAEEGVTPENPSDEDDQPLTMGKYKQIQKQDAQKTALQLANAIPDENEQQLVIHYLSTRIIPSGDPAEDLRFARAAVNSIKSSQIAEEATRKTEAQRNGSGSGSPAKQEVSFEPSAEESAYMKPPFNLTKEQIIAARPK